MTNPEISKLMKEMREKAESCKATEFCSDTKPIKARREFEQTASPAENARIIGMGGSREAALRTEVEKLKGIVREYQNSAFVHWSCGNVGELCSLYKRADEAVKERT